MSGERSKKTVCRIKTGINFGVHFITPSMVILLANLPDNTELWIKVGYGFEISYNQNFNLVYKGWESSLETLVQYTREKCYFVIMNNNEKPNLNPDDFEIMASFYGGKLKRDLIYNDEKDIFGSHFGKDGENEIYYERNNLHNQNLCSYKFNKTDTNFICYVNKIINNKLRFQIADKLFEDPLKFVFLDEKDEELKITKELSQKSIICGPGASSELKYKLSKKNVSSEIEYKYFNTNIPHTEWDTLYMCISYYGTFDMNSTPRECIRVTSKSNYYLKNGDILFFIGSLFEWENYRTKRLKRKPRVYIYCVLLNQPLPPFKSNVQMPLTFENYYFESPNHWKWYRFLYPDTKYLDDVSVQRGEKYHVYFPVKSKVKSNNFEFGCGIECNCEQLRINHNVLTHHGDVHCKTPDRCCIIGCKAKFTGIGEELKNKRTLHYIRSKSHKFDMNDDYLLLTKERDHILDTWLGGGQIRVVTKNKMIGASSKCITNTELYAHIKKIIEEKFDNVNIILQVLVILGPHSKISIGVLYNKCKVIENFNIPRYSFLEICRELAKLNVVLISKRSDCYNGSLNELHSIVGDDDLYDRWYKKLVTQKLISEFIKCEFVFVADEKLTNYLDEMGLLTQDKTHLKFHELIQKSYTKMKNASSPVEKAIKKCFVILTHDHNYNDDNDIDIKDIFFENYTIPLSLKKDKFYKFVINVKTNDGIRLLEKAKNLDRDIKNNLCIKKDDLKKYPQLLNLKKEEEISELSMISSRFHSNNLVFYWNIKQDYSAYAEPQKSKNDLIIVSKYYKMANDDFYKIINELNKFELEFLVKIYQYCEILTYEFSNEIKLIPEIIKQKFVNMGLCKVCNNLLYPLVSPLVIKTRLTNLERLYKDKTKIEVPPKIAIVDDSLETITNIKFDKNVDYYNHFRQFDSARRTSVPEHRIPNFKLKMTLYELVKECSLDYNYNVSSFFLYVDAYGTADQEIYVKPKKKAFKYPINTLDQLNINLLRSKYKITAELLRQLNGNEIFENREPTYSGLVWILNHIRYPISRQYFSYLKIIGITNKCFTIRTNCGMIATINSDKIPDIYICDVCTKTCIHDRILKEVLEINKPVSRARIYPNLKLINECDCKPIVTNYNNVFYDGEYFVAKQSILSNQVIFQDLPVTVPANCFRSKLFIKKYQDIKKTCDIVRFLKYSQWNYDNALFYGKTPWQAKVESTQYNQIHEKFYLGVACLRQDDELANAILSITNDVITIKSIKKIDAYSQVIIPTLDNRRLCIDCFGNNSNKLYVYKGTCTFCGAARGRTLIVLDRSASMRDYNNYIINVYKQIELYCEMYKYDFFDVITIGYSNNTYTRCHGGLNAEMLNFDGTASGDSFLYPMLMEMNSFPKNTKWQVIFISAARFNDDKKFFDTLDSLPSRFPQFMPVFISCGHQSAIYQLMQAMTPFSYGKSYFLMNDSNLGDVFTEFQQQAIIKKNITSPLLNPKAEMMNSNFPIWPHCVNRKKDFQLLVQSIKILTLSQPNDERLSTIVHSLLMMTQSQNRDTLISLAKTRIDTTNSAIIVNWMNEEVVFDDSVDIIKLKVLELGQRIKSCRIGLK